MSMRNDINDAVGNCYQAANESGWWLDAKRADHKIDHRSASGGKKF